jgi:hypothetical protein
VTDHGGPGPPARGGRGRRTRQFPRLVLGSAAAAVAVGALAAGLSALAPRLPIRGEGGVALEGVELWLLTVFTAGVLSLLAALSAWIGQGWGGRGAREGLAELRARSEALEAARIAAGSERASPGDSGVTASPPGTQGRQGRAGEGPWEGAAAPGKAASEGEVLLPAGWFAAVGGWLLLLYAGGWILAS